jgi:hypothetical protein
MGTLTAINPDQHHSLPLLQVAHRNLLILDEDRNVRRVATMGEWTSWIDAHIQECGTVGFHQDGDLRISTQFLAIDMSHRADGVPLGFESLVWMGKLQVEGQRYSTWNEAQCGHDALVLLYHGKVQ